MGEIINGVFAIIDELEQFIGASVPAGLSGLMQQMNDVLRAAVLPAYNVGLEIGNALTRGITEAISAGLVPVGAAVDGMIPRPGMPLAATAGAGPSTAGANGSRTVILENGAFQVVINDAMDAEEFKFTVVEIIRELTE